MAEDNTTTAVAGGDARRPPADPASAAGAPRAAGGDRLTRLLTGVGPILIALLAVSAVLSVMTEQFLTSSNLENVIVQSSVVGIAAVGATYVIITAGIDLSVGSVVVLSSIVAATAMRDSGSGIVGLVAALLVGASVGAFNGMSVTVLRLTPFIATLAVLAMGRGLALQISEGRTIFGFPESFTFLGSGSLLGFATPLFVVIVLFVAGHFVLSRTTFGHQVYAIGGNREAARLAGIPVRRVEFLVYVLAGACAGLAAIVLTGRLNSALPSAAAGLELQVIAAVVIGGTSLFGGRGNLIGTFIGVLLIGVINNGLTLLNVSPFWVQFTQGAVIFLAVLVDALNQRRLGGRT